jgi:hypothetical protein
MSYCQSLEHKLAGNVNCQCGLANAQANAQDNWSSQIAAQQTQMAGQLSRYAGLSGQSYVGAMQAMWNQNAPSPDRLSTKRPCELCEADAYGSAEVRAADGSLQRVSMCGQCARDVRD